MTRRRYHLSDGRIFEKEDGALNVRTFNGMVRKHRPPIWRRVNADGTTQTVDAKIQHVVQPGTGNHYLQVGDEPNPVKVERLT